jgi:hypothetical protein
MPAVDDIGGAEITENGSYARLLSWFEVDCAGDVRGERLLTACALDANCLGDTGHADALETELDLRY